MAPSKASTKETVGAWQPSFDAAITLKQLGVSSERLRSLANEYGEVAPYPNDRDFQYFVLNQIEPDIPLLPLHWQPSNGLKITLSNSGYSQVLINTAIEQFVIAKRECGEIIEHPDAAFKQFLMKTYPRKRTGALSRASMATLALAGLDSRSIVKSLELIAKSSTVPLAELPETELMRLVQGLTTRQPLK